MADGSKVNRSQGATIDEMFGRTVQYHFKPFHLRETDRRPKAFEVLVLGDSYTLGWLLHAHETFISKLQQQADRHFGNGKIHFLNAGTGGWGTADQMVFLENMGDRIKPDAVLVIYNNDDIHRSLSSTLIRFSERPYHKLVRQSNPVVWYKRFFAGGELYNAAITHSHVLRLVRNVFLKRAVKAPEVAQPSPETVRQGVQLGKMLFTRMKTWADTRKIPFWVCSTGWFDEVNNPVEPIKPFWPLLLLFFEHTGCPSPILLDTFGGFENLVPRFGRSQTDIRIHKVQI
ncbi:MAG: SGNH/GDSL hydrolase family protein [Bacteroidetes Order II. Incertae sedis bacterium]|nr:SGNH/GDSL hydrolase family protein [Bacteroidetes Order II. bacterium]